MVNMGVVAANWDLRGRSYAISNLPEPDMDVAVPSRACASDLDHGVSRRVLILYDLAVRRPNVIGAQPSALTVALLISPAFGYVSKFID